MPTLNRRTTVVLIALLLVLVCIAVVVYTVYLSPTGTKARMHSDLGESVSDPVAHFTSLDGSIVDMDEYEGDMLIVNFWASWSPFTEADHRVLASIKATFTERITIRAVNRKEDVATAKAYLDSIGRLDGIEYVTDTTDILYAERGGYAMPETVIFDVTGNEIYRVRGMLKEEELRQIITDLLATID